jgi:hypothetical protein
VITDLRLPAATARAFGGFIFLAVAAGIALTVLAHDLRASFDGVLLVVIVVVGGVGYVVARRQPANPIGWLLLGASALFALYAVGVLYTVLDYHRRHGDLPLGRVALAAEPIWAFGVVLLGLAVALFPNGTIGSRRWRIVAIVYLVAGVWFTGLWSVAEAAIHIGRDFNVDGVGNYVGIQHGFAGAIGGIGWAASPLVVVLFIAFVVRQWAAWRHAVGERREQLTWLMSGGAVSIVSIIVVVNTNVSSHWRIATDIVGLGLTAIPLAIGIGILKYRLYDIDRLISRTLSYAIVTGLLVVVFAGIVVLATDVLPFSSPVAVAASTLAAAALFNPLRGRVQRIVDRRFNRARYDAEATVAAFGTRLRDAVDLDTIQAELLGTVHRSFEPTHTSVWLPPAAVTRRER